MIAVCTLMSRVTGLARDMVMMQVFGAARINDAFQFAFQIPNLFRRLFAEGAMSAVFIPVFTATLEKEGRQSAWALLARTLALLATVLIVAVILAELVVLAAWFFLPGATTVGADPTAAAQPAARQLQLALTALMLPFMLTVCILALLSSVLNCVGSFVPGALAPLVLNVVMLIGVLLIGPLLSRDDLSVQIYGVAASVLVAGVIQLLLLVPALRANRVRIGWRFEPREAKVRRIIGLMGPVLLGQGVLVIGVFLDTFVCLLLTHNAGEPATGGFLGLSFTYPLEEGAVSVLTVAQRLYQFPLGVLAVSLAIAAFPTFSRLAARQDWTSWAEQVRGSLRLTIFVGLLAGAMMWLVSEPIVRLLFEYRRFDAEDTARAARILMFYGVGMWAFCAQHIVLRAFYSVSDVRTPLRISCVLVPLNLILSIVLVWFEPIREAAFAIASSITASISVAVGLIILQRSTNANILNRSGAVAIVKMLLAAGAGMASVWLLRPLLFAPRPVAPGLATDLLQRAVDVGGSLATGVLVCFAAAFLLGLPEPRQVLSRWHKRRDSETP